MVFSPIKSAIIAESDVLYLQNIFLTPGIHHIDYDDIAKMRTLIDSILKSLQYHHKVACLSFANLLLANDVCDILNILIADDYLVNNDRLMLFFLEQFYFDFLWIEETPQLIDSLWYAQFNKYLIEFNLIRSMPIIKIRFKSI